MKRVFTYTFVLVMASLVLYGGTGINVYSFCCEDCQDAGLDVLTGDKCCEIHGHSHEDIILFEDGNKHVGHEQEMCCNLKRLEHDWNSVDVYTPLVKPFITDLFDAGLPALSIVPLPFTREIHTVMPTGPPLPPRTYLNLLTTLLI